MLEVHRCSFGDWKPSPVVALATSVHGTCVAVGRSSGEIELWRIAAGSVGWTMQANIPGRKDAAMSALAWCLATKKQPQGKLFSTGMDGNLTEWDMSSLQIKTSVPCYGGPVWNMAVQPVFEDSQDIPENSFEIEEDDGSDEDLNNDEENADSSEIGKFVDEQLMALALDDGCVRLFTVTDTDGAQFKRSFPRVSGRVLSLAWSPNGKKLFAGSSDGCIRCWDPKNFNEMYRITAGIGGLSLKDGLCIWSLVALNDETETIVSGDASGSVQFWDGRFGTLIQSQTRHRADVLTLAASPSQDSVFSGGVDGQVILFQKQKGKERVSTSSGSSGPWVYIGGRRAHSHDVKALTMGVVPSHESDAVIQTAQKKQKRMKRDINQEPPRWQKAGVAMLLSGGNDAQLFTYPADSFMDFYPHAVCPSPQLPHVELTSREGGSSSLLLMQQQHHVDVWRVHCGRQVAESPASEEENTSRLAPTLITPNGANGVVKSLLANGLSKKRKSLEVSGNGHAGQGQANGVHFSSTVDEGKVLEVTDRKEPSLVARIKSSSAEFLSCSAISPNGSFVAFSDSSRVRLFELSYPKAEASKAKAKSRISCEILKKKLPNNIPSAHQLTFSADSENLFVAERKGGILIYNLADECMTQLCDSIRPEVTTAKDWSSETLPPVVSLLATSKDGRWLASVDSCGHISVFSLRKNKLHWSVPSFVEFPPTAVMFHPTNCGELIVSTSANQIQVLNVRKKDKSEWSKANGDYCPPELLGLPCGISGLSMSPSGDNKLLAYSTRYMCSLDLERPFIDKEREVGKSESEGADDILTDRERTRKKDGIKINKTLPVKELKQKTSNVKIIPFKDRTIFVGHTSSNAIILLEKEWDQVVRQLPPPFKYHRYGT